MSAAKPLPSQQRTDGYFRQTGRRKLTARQRRRWQHKILRRAKLEREGRL